MGRVAMRVLLWALVSTLVVLRAAAAHEVQPSVADITIGTDRADIEIDWVIEAPVAGIDLEGVANTNEAEGAAEYDRLRALDPAGLETAFREVWPEIAAEITARAGEADVPLTLEEVRVSEVGDVSIPRNSLVRLTAELPPGGEGLVFGWEASLGPLVVRQIGAENGYAAFLENGELSDPIPRVSRVGGATGGSFVDYVGAGFERIVPLGLDHILFVLGMFFLAARMRPVLGQVAAFTIAHSLALAMGALGVVGVPAGIVEPLIAASLVYVGVENLLVRRLMPWRPVLVFAFGLLHGLALGDDLQGSAPGPSAPALAGFNIGVELGQFAVIAAAFLAFGWLFSKHGWYRLRVSTPVSTAIALIGLFWVLESTGTVAANGAWAPLAALVDGGMPVLMGAGAALAVMLAVTALVFLTDRDTVRDWGGFLTSFVSFIAVTGAFTGLDYTVTAVLVVAWVVALRLQSIGGADGPGPL